MDTEKKFRCWGQMSLSGGSAVNAAAAMPQVTIHNFTVNPNAGAANPPVVFKVMWTNAAAPAVQVWVQS